MKPSLQTLIGALVLALSLVGSLASAAVWETIPGRQWTEQDELDYSEFISKSATPNFFGKLGPAFANLRIDCADAVYAYRAYFARSRGLPFEINRGRVTQAMTRFDSYWDADERFVQFMLFIADQNGTVNLAYTDTYPIGIDEIRSGDVFLYKFESAPGTYTRHAYIIKNVNRDGTFDILYSTQARRDAGLPLSRIEKYTFPNANWVPRHSAPPDQYRWGFKRLKSGENVYLDQSRIGLSNYEQYELAISLDARFFAYVKNRRAIVQETTSEMVQRYLGFICHELKDRVSLITVTQQFLKSNQGQGCMNPTLYDTHSTPSRDGAILQSYKELRDLYHNLGLEGRLPEVAPDLQKTLFILFGGKRDAVSLAALNKSCDFSKGRGFTTDMARFYDALSSGRVSNHPHDDLQLRWGLPSAVAPSLCPRY